MFFAGKKPYIIDVRGDDEIDALFAFLNADRFVIASDDDAGILGMERERERFRERDSEREKERERD